MKFYLKNFGCRLNQSEGDSIAESLLCEGFVRSNLENAELVVVNGCTVTARSDQKLRQFVRAVRRMNDNARIVLLGCTSQAIGNGLLKEISEVETVDNRYRYCLQKYFKAEKPIPKNDFPKINGLGIIRTRAWVKIQDGCNRFCSYCIVPLLRGKSRSRSPSKIIEQIRKLHQSGFSEIVLTGVDIGDWRESGETLSCLIKTILQKTDLPLLRLSSLEPPGLTRNLIDLISSENRIAAHLHIPIQSGSKKVLAAMKRGWYDPTDICESLEKIRLIRPEMCFGTDIIVGFPEERDSDFQRTRQILMNGTFAYAHLFRYSPRPGTSSLNLPILDSKVVNERSKILAKIDSFNRNEFATKFIGSKLRFLVEKVSGEHIFGHTSNYLRVKANGTSQRGKFETVYVTDAYDMKVSGVIES